METHRLLSDLKLDVVHLARYSVREGTVAARRIALRDNVPEEDKLRRLHELDDLQEKILDEINKKYLGEKVDVLFEEKVKDRWRGRTPTNKLVFVVSDDDLRGKILPVTITWTGPWSMQAVLQRQPELISL
jgi:tRNA-2-methylthio-N6-dimethylallyladenosine synthase